MLSLAIFLVGILAIQATSEHLDSEGSCSVPTMSFRCPEDQELDLEKDGMSEGVLRCYPSNIYKKTKLVQNVTFNVLKKPQKFPLFSNMTSNGTRICFKGMSFQENIPAFGFTKGDEEYIIDFEINLEHRSNRSGENVNALVVSHYNYTSEDYGDVQVSSKATPIHANETFTTTITVLENNDVEWKLNRMEVATYTPAEPMTESKFFYIFNFHGHVDYLKFSTRDNPCTHNDL